MTYQFSFILQFSVFQYQRECKRKSVILPFDADVCLISVQKREFCL